MELLGSVKNYDWGKRGITSKVAQLAKVCDNNFELDETKTYSELWMGDHCSGPSKVKATGEYLDAYLEKNTEAIGGMKSLPFLFKVLSIGKALSIQVHPNKDEAEKLHAERPDIYKDPNHKPELAIALTPFLALCGFRPFGEIVTCFKNYLEIVELIGKENVEQFVSNPTSSTLRNCFSALMRSPDKNLNECIDSLLKKFQTNTNLNLYEKTFININKDFPNDIGSLSMFFLNLIELKPGEAIYLAANVPHAYLEGDCIECMACSDNVIRAGLTPKYKDLDTLIRMLEYEGKSKEEMIYKAKKMNEKENYCKAFIPPVKDFAVIEISIPIVTSPSYSIAARKYGSILLVLSGKGTLAASDTSLEINQGSIIFLPASNNFTLKLNEVPFVAYQAMYNDF